jgi:hypothetical protein
MKKIISLDNDLLLNFEMSQFIGGAAESTWSEDIPSLETSEWPCGDWTTITRDDKDHLVSECKRPIECK